MIEPRCQVCKSTMKVRTGRNGDFYFCPDGNHGTIDFNGDGEQKKPVTKNHRPRQQPKQPKHSSCTC